MQPHTWIDRPLTHAPTASLTVHDASGVCCNLVPVRCAMCVCVCQCRCSVTIVHVRVVLDARLYSYTCRRKVVSKASERPMRRRREAQLSKSIRRSAIHGAIH